MRDDAVITFDFLVGFTIFLISFIFVAAMVPHALFAVQSSRIDYDAVAYRTGVILTEDPGMPASPDFPVWEYQMDSEDVVRLGLAVEHGTPHVLSRAKIERFFDTEFFSYPDDYRRSLIFGDYPYAFNITLTTQGVIRSVGPLPPASYGTVRRVVVVKEPSILTIDGMLHPEYRVAVNTTPNQRFTIEIPCEDLLNRSIEPVFRIDPRTDPLQIDIRNFDQYLNNTSNSATLTDIRITRKGVLVPFTDYTLKTDGTEQSLPASVGERIEFTLHAVTNPPWRETDTILITFVFEDDPPEAMVSGTHIYDYANATLPDLMWGTLEVAVW